jgi:hypothetical protein
MARVRAEMGPGARIVKAEKVRTGGVAGFFAREHYELTVEVPDPPPTAPGRPRPTTTAPTAPVERAAVGIEALLAAADAAEQGATGASAGHASAPGRPGASDQPPTPRPPAQAPPEQPVAVSTSSADFADILRSMRDLVGDRAPAGDSAAPGPAGPGTTPEPPDDVVVVPEVPPTAVPARNVVVSEPPRPSSGSSVTALLELGVPTRLLTGFTDHDAPAPLSVLVRRFEKPPTARLLPGGVVAVVGESDLALRTAMQMAARADVDPTEIVLAGVMPAVPGHGRRLQTPSALARLRARVPADAPTIVAIGTADDRHDWGVAAEMLDALTAHQVWAAVDARRKVVELRRWLRAVGAHRPVDALAACNTFEAQAPGTMLGLGIPVGWVDGLPATPVVWAAVLSERLADDARWD